MWYKNICSASFSCHNARVWQTDRRTDGRTDRIRPTTPKTALAYARAIKTCTGTWQLTAACHVCQCQAGRIIVSSVTPDLHWHNTTPKMFGVSVVASFRYMTYSVHTTSVQSWQPLLVSTSIYSDIDRCNVAFRSQSLIVYNIWRIVCHCLSSNRYKITRVCLSICVSVCPKYLSSTIATAVFSRSSSNLECRSHFYVRWPLTPQVVNAHVR